MALRHRQRAEQQRRHAAGGDVPEPQRADDLVAVKRDKRQTLRRQAAVAQPLAGLTAARGAQSLVEQRLAGRDMARLFGRDAQVIGDKRQRQKRGRVAVGGIGHQGHRGLPLGCAGSRVCRTILVLRGRSRSG